MIAATRWAVGLRRAQAAENVGEPRVQRDLEPAQAASYAAAGVLYCRHVADRTEVLLCEELRTPKRDPRPCHKAAAGHCPYGAACRFTHPGDAEGARPLVPKRWLNIPGGKREAEDEDPWATAAREFLEETALGVSADQASRVLWVPRGRYALYVVCAEEPPDLPRAFSERSATAALHWVPYQTLFDAATAVLPQVRAALFGGAAPPAEIPVGDRALPLYPFAGHLLVTEACGAALGHAS